MGAGALGGAFGFLLAEAGFDVTLVDVDRAKVDAINSEGLTLLMPDGSSRHRLIRATADPAEVGHVDLVQVAVKGYHTLSAATLAVPLVGPATYVLSLQNGLGNLDRIASVVGPERVVGGITAHSAMPIGPTEIRFNAAGMGGVHIGRFDGTRDDGLAPVADVFIAAGLEGHVVEGDVHEPIWRKLLANSSVNPVAALMGLTGREIQEMEEASGLVRALACETGAVARAQGFTFAELDDPGEFVIGTLDWVGDNKVSMLQDVEAGRRTEIDTLNLAVVEVGEKYGVDTPLNWTIGSLVRTMERKMLRDRRNGGGAA